MKASPRLAPASIDYQVELLDLHAHLFRVKLHITRPHAEQILRLPVWIPGSYLLREFSQNLQNLQCHQGTHTVAQQQLDKATWRLACNTTQALHVQYEIYANDPSVRGACLGSTRGFFNGTSLFLCAEGFEDVPHHLELLSTPATPHWNLATALTPVRTQSTGFGLYRAAHYAELVDCPVEMGTFWSGNFLAYGIAHRVVVANAPPSFDGERLLADTKTICETTMAFWHGAPSRSARKAQGVPFTHYVFMLKAVPEGYGGLEHRNSTALICAHQDLPRLPRNTLAAPESAQPEGYTELLELICHEYFHTWNVKRLRPAEFAHYDYTRENYTELLWFFEGFTSYYDQLLLRRAKLLDDAGYLKALSKTINHVLQTPGRRVQSLAQASFDAWVKYYRPSENTANATVSYYTKGAMLALCLDLTLRAQGKTTLDAVMRALWTRCAGGPMKEDDLLAVLHTLAQRTFHQELKHWAHGKKDLPWAELLAQHGIEVQHEPAHIAQQLGLRIKEGPGLIVQQVLRASAAEKAGFCSGDEWIAIELPSGPARGPWRMHSLQDLMLYTNQSKKITALIARNKQLQQLSLTLPQTDNSSIRLSVRNAKTAALWLDKAPTLPKR